MASIFSPSAIFSSPSPSLPKAALNPPIIKSHHTLLTTTTKTSSSNAIIVTAAAAATALILSTTAPSLADTTNTYHVYYGTAASAANYGGYGGNSSKKDSAEYVYDVPDGWKERLVSKVEKGTNGTDSEFYNPKKKAEKEYLTFLAGYRQLAPKDVVLNNLALSDVDLQDLISSAENIRSEERKDDNGQVFYVYEIDGVGAHSLISGFWGQNLTDAVNNGSVTAERVADMATRVLTSWYYLGQDNGYPKNNVYPYTEEHEPVDVRGDHASLIRKIGAAGTILVKNTNGALPLKKPRFVSLYGPDAPTARRPWQDPARYGGNYAEGWGWNTFDGTLVVGGGSGGAAPPYVVSPFEAIRERVTKDGGILRWDFESINPSPRFANSDVCLVFINSFASERWDRVSLTDEFGDELVNNVAANCSNTIVVVHSAGIRVVDAWVENPNVTAVFYGLLPGQESGNSLVDLLWGDISPSGKMPFTVAKKEEDYGHLLNSTVTFDAFPQQDFTEGLYIDYRAFDKKGIEPRYEFGFGLSYSAFEIGDLKVNLDSLANIQPLPHPNVSVEQGGHPELWEVIATATASMTNTGNVTAAEVAQLYVGIPGDTFQTPIRQLRGFQKVTLLPGKTTTATFPLTRRDLSVWDVTVQQWRLQSGSYKLHVGSSSRDLTATQQLVIRN